MEKLTLIITTVDTTINANKIARYLVKNHLAACVNIVPKITSFYRWEGKVIRDDEVLLFIKTTKALFNKVKEEIENIGLYEVPEIISFDIKDGNDEYLNWIISSVR